jgi:molybdate transport system substrate-binding protein
MALADTVQLYSAGSLRGALTDVAKAYEAASGNTVQAKFGASGLLKDEIVGGAKPDVFASANMEHPQALHDAKKSGPVVLFARNRLCALVKPDLKIDSASLVERMLDPQIKLGISTPKADPAGDYAFEVFRKADASKRARKRRWKRRRCNSPAAPPARRRPPAAPSMAGMWRKAAPTSSSLIAPMHWRRRRRTPASRSWPCRKT